MHAYGPVVDAHQHFWDPATGWYVWLGSYDLRLPA